MQLNKVTEEMIECAETYLPVLEKERIAEHIAQGSIDRLNVRAQGDGVDLSMPDMYKESGQRKARYMLGALLRYYIKLPVTAVEGEDFMLSADDYDKAAGAHVFNQIERMKHSRKDSVRNRAFNLTADYRELEKQVNKEIYSMLTVMNDPATRIMTAMQSLSSPESFEAARKELEKLTRQMELYKEEKAQEIADAEDER